jgi:hypothetical protein
MKYSTLRSVAHNIADSLAVGLGFMIGVYVTDIFAEAASSPEGFIVVDFLTGNTEGAQPSASLSRAIHLYRDALPALCEREGISVSSFCKLTARFSPGALNEREVSVVVEHRDGRRFTDDYIGTPLRHRRVVDQRGRVRRRRTGY